MEVFAIMHALHPFPLRSAPGRLFGIAKPRRLLRTPEALRTPPMRGSEMGTSCCTGLVGEATPLVEGV